MFFSSIAKTIVALINLPSSNWWYGCEAATKSETYQTFWLTHGIKVEQV